MTSRETRIAEIPEIELSLEQRAALQAVMGGRGFLPTPYKVWLHSPELVGLMEALGTFLNKRSSLTSREVEIAILVVARHWSGEMVFGGHAITAAQLGITKEAIAAIEAGTNAELQFDSQRERAVYTITRTAEESASASDDVFNAAVTTLGRDGLAELLALIGYFSSVAIAMKLHRVPKPTPKT